MVGDIYFFIDSSWIFTLISTGFSLYYSLINKGSLVEEVTVEYAKQEVRVLHYTLFNQEHKTVVPFEGLSWSILPGGQSLDRFRIIPKEGPRIIICEGGLGWKSEDIERLSLALSKVVDMEPWYMKI